MQEKRNVAWCDSSQFYNFLRVHNPHAAELYGAKSPDTEARIHWLHQCHICARKSHKQQEKGRASQRWTPKNRGRGGGGEKKENHMATHECSSHPDMCTSRRCLC